MIAKNYADLSDYKAVYDVLFKYCNEGCVANIPEVKKAFHEKAVMNGYAGDGNYVYGPIQGLYDLYEKIGGSTRNFHVDVLDIAGNIAVGKCVIEDWHGHDYVDYHELIKENGEWKIIAKIYNQF
jgi:hypothetical protein